MRYRYSSWDEEEVRRILQALGLMSLYNQLLLMTGGDVEEVFRILKILQSRGIIGADIDLDAFREELLRQKLISKGTSPSAAHGLTRKGEKKLRADFLNQIFANLKKDIRGEHLTSATGQGKEVLPEIRPYQFGDATEDIAFRESLEHSLRRGIDEFRIEEEDLHVHETAYNTGCATVLMLDISHSMVLYGEDRITPAKKVALALTELILTQFPHDSLNCILFGDDAWEVKIDDLPYVTVGPYHTNTKAGLELAQKILMTRHQANRQIFMITDGKPSCIFKGGELYKNPWGLDPEIVNKTLNEAGNCRRRGISIITFMIARDAYLVDFVERMTRANQGRAYFTSPSHLGEYLFVDYIKNRKKKIR